MTRLRHGNTLLHKLSVQLGSHPPGRAPQARARRLPGPRPHPSPARTPAAPEVELPATPLEWIEPFVGSERTETVRDTLHGVRDLLDGRTVWHISDNPVRGGVAELLRADLPYLAGEGISTRWTTLDAPPEFRAFTKSLYYRLCGERGSARPGHGPALHRRRPRPPDGRAHSAPARAGTRKEDSASA
ncbi:hypothetical protein [Streptomyces lavendulae]|uniref:hypothetical protein n=1 Tax=Streptomyces lavendulae TaxID=1914 RepID=UPI0024A56F1E|nr:hypothetical protein [Streptomyces lavendulae]GLX22083.1 hypothetical protein Slala01_57270 [Streptomyces lavendulae subsp. lavendulae]GLX29791.1 hypothetical protein Slala02_56110 [Streptomyces lavendulae subsp. lavendulae]